jgi:hypothetical protein
MNETVAKIFIIGIVLYSIAEHYGLLDIVIHYIEKWIHRYERK